ncbi:hypothetical protein P3342_005952 [Pyrenophora teres f. teres]|nr:hypothetical protein P3342_005952 [Pyrenophora teres f. teres]
MMAWPTGAYTMPYQIGFPFIHRQLICTAKSRYCLVFQEKAHPMLQHLFYAPQQSHQ